MIQGRNAPLVCLVHCGLGAAFRALGWRTLELLPKEPIFDVQAALDEAGATPDLLLQQETLTGRVLLAGLEHLRCPKFFWAIDVHLNAFWHVFYARLFDGLLCSQKAWLPLFRRAGSRAEWLPWYGPSRDWRPFADRSRDLAFVGHLSGERPTRQNMLAFLGQGFDLEVVQGVYGNAALEAYAQARAVPNESIMGEINFRLFEAAGAGALVFNVRNEELSELYEPGLEVETYDHALELADKLRFLLKHPAVTERMARAGWERTRREHLAVHRAARILELARETGDGGATGAEARKAFWLAAQGLLRAGRLAADPAELRTICTRMETELMRLPGEPEVAAALLTHWIEADHPEATARATAMIMAVLARNEHPDCFDLNLAGTMACLRLGLFDPAKGFWRRHQQSQGRHPPSRPESARDLYVLWARELRRLGLPHRRGLLFETDRHLAASAFECLLQAHRLDPENADAVRAMEALLADERGAEPTRVGFLSWLSLRAPNDWRLGLRLGLANLRVFRVEAGSEELAAAQDRARLAGEEERFLRALAAQDPGGAMRAALDGPRAQR